LLKAQPPFGLDDLDGLQYQLFCPDLIVGIRIFKTLTLFHSSAWVYRDGEMSEFAISSQALKQNDGNHLDISGDGFAFCTQPQDSTAPTAQGNNEDSETIDGEITVQGSGGKTMHIRFKVIEQIKWPDTVSTVIHQPHIECEIQIGGETHTGLGYCKRFSWTPMPHYWGYRFIQGFADDGAIKLWTAEANFGDKKYDYFYLYLPDGSLVQADDGISCHRQNAAFAKVGGQACEVEIDELGCWEAKLTSDGMDSLLRQKVCRLTVRVLGREHQGMAINETCYGTLE